jgi:hypothetical protein
MPLSYYQAYDGEMKVTTTETDARKVALFCKEVYDHMRKRDRRRPTALQTVVATYAAAIGLIDAEARYVGAPSSLRSSMQVLDAMRGPAVRFCENLKDTAYAVIAFIDAAGDSPATAKSAESVELDRRILAVAAELWRHDTFSERAIARSVGLHKSSVNDRLTSRATRTLLQLHEIAPSIWSDKCRPVNGPADGNGAVWTNDLALAA